MIDLLKFCPCKLFVCYRKVKELRKRFKGFIRAHTRFDTHNSATIEVTIEKRRVLSIYVKVLEDGSWWVREVVAVLPALLHGHNGILIRKPEDYALALTILDYLLSLVSTPFSKFRLPAIGAGNHGFIKLVESAIQVNDPERRFLRGSHFARLAKQYRGTGIIFGESTSCITRNLKFSVYDKNNQMWDRDLIAGTEAEATKIEIVHRNAETLGRSLATVTGMRKKPRLGPSKETAFPVAASLSLADSYGLLKKGLGRVSGLGWIPKGSDLQEIKNKNALLLSIGLGDGATDSRNVDRVLQQFRRLNMNRATYAKADVALRTYAMGQVAEDPLSVIPDDQADIQWADVSWGAREHAWAKLLGDLDAPITPDPVIAKAWTQSSILPSQPDFRDMAGVVAPNPPPFYKDPLTFL